MPFKKPWWGKRPRATRSATAIPSGTTGDWGRRPSLRASCFAGMAWIALPSSTTPPDIGRISRAKVLSSVDFPQAFAPMMTLIFPSGGAMLTPRMMIFLS